MSTLDAPQMIEPNLNNVSARSIGIRYGAIASLIAIAIALIFHVAGLTSYTDQNSATNWIATLLTWAAVAGAMIMGMKKYREEIGGFLTFGKAFGVGLWAALVWALITAVWTYVFFAVVEPDLTETILEATRENMLAQGQSEEQVDQAMQISAGFMTPPMFSLFGGIFTFITGLIIALIAAAVAQRKPPVDSIA